MRRTLSLAALATVAATGIAVGQADAGTIHESYPFQGVGVVYDADAPVPPTSFEGEDLSFIISVEDPADMGYQARGHLKDLDGDGAADDLQIYARPGAVYHRESVPGSGVYADSDYDGVIVEGERIRVKGIRITRQNDATRFFANEVWNPPKQMTSSGNGVGPACNEAEGSLLKAYDVVATVHSREARVPCTNIGTRYGDSFRIDNVNQPQFGGDLRPDLAAAVGAFGGVPDLHGIPGYTRYTFRHSYGNAPTTWNEMIRRDRLVQVLGSYMRAGGTYLFFPKQVISPPYDPATLFRPSLSFEAGRTSHQYDPAAGSANTIHEGVSNGRSFPQPGGRVRWDLSWVRQPNSARWSVTGTYLFKDGVNTLYGDVDGTAGGTEFNFILTAEGGTGFWCGTEAGIGEANGLMEFEDPSNSGPPIPDTPVALEGDVRLDVYNTRQC